MSPRHLDNDGLDLGSLGEKGKPVETRLKDAERAMKLSGNATA
jgi:hypothetical protein